MLGLRRDQFARRKLGSGFRRSRSIARASLSLGACSDATATLSVAGPLRATLRKSTTSCSERSAPRCSGFAHRGGIRQLLLKCREDFDPLDRVDAEIGVQRHAEVEHLHRVAGLLRATTASSTLE